jgi:hypothetical protein
MFLTLLLPDSHAPSFSAPLNREMHSVFNRKQQKFTQVRDGD